MWPDGSTLDRNMALEEKFPVAPAGASSINDCASHGRTVLVLAVLGWAKATVVSLES